MCVPARGYNVVMLHRQLRDYWYSETKLCIGQHPNAKYFDQAHLNLHLREMIRDRQSQFQPWLMMSLTFLFLAAIGLSFLTLYALWIIVINAIVQTINSMLRFRQRNHAFRKYVLTYSTRLLAKCRSCRYDLCGITSIRCPECGASTLLGV
jgi:hypothetical protein